MLWTTWIYLIFTSIFTRIVPPFVVMRLPQNKRLEALAAEMPLIVLTLLLIHMLAPIYVCEEIVHSNQALVEATSATLALICCLGAFYKKVPLVIAVFGAIAVRFLLKNYLLPPLF